MIDQIPIPDGFFMRVETTAGGIGAGNLAFARAALSKLKPNARHSNDPEMIRFRRAYLTALFAKRQSLRY